MPLKKVRTVGVALSSWKSSLTVVARGCFHSQAFPTLLHNSFIWDAQAQPQQLTNGWWRDCRLPLPHHQHLSDWIVFVFSASIIAACPERSWKNLLATSFPPPGGPCGFSHPGGGRYQRSALTCRRIHSLMPWDLASVGFPVRWARLASHRSPLSTGSV